MTKEVAKDYTKLPAYEALKPLMVAMRLVGLLYVYDDSSRRRRKCRGLSLPMIYSWTMVIVSWGVVAFNASTNMVHNVRLVGPPLFGTLTCIVSFGQYAINSTSLARASHSRKGIKKFFVCLDELDKYGGLITPLPWLRKLAIGACVIVCISFFFATPFTIYVMFSTNVIDILMASYTIIPVKILYSLAEAYFIAVWLLVNAFELSIGIFLHHEFKLFQKSLAARTNLTTGRFEGSLERERERYVLMTRVVRAADNILSVHQAAALGCNVVSICLLLYLMLYYPSFVMNEQAGFFSAFWLLVCTADILFVCVSGILVTSEVSFTFTIRRV